MITAKKVVGWVAVLGAATTTLVYSATTTERLDFAHVAYFALAIWFVGTMALSLFHRERDEDPLPEGRVVAVVPVFNEDPEHVNATVWSLINSSYQPDVIYVVDDGSEVPVVPFDHPKVKWFWQVNKGKQHAQSVVYREETEPFDFLVTVDSDSVVDKYAVERCLRAFSDPTVNAASGVVYAINRTKNAITLATDLHYTQSCVVVRNAFSTMGGIFTTSGALAVYRAHIMRENLEEYLQGSVGDDRHMTHFCLRSGKAVSVTNSYVYTHVPETLGVLFRQRTRWARSYYRYVMWDLRFLKGKIFWVRYVNFTVVAVSPLFLIFALFIFPIVGHAVPWSGFAFWLAFSYCQTARYVTERYGVSLPMRLFTWIVGTPLLLLKQVFIIGPASYYALTKVKSHSWQTRKTTFVRT